MVGGCLLSASAVCVLVYLCFGGSMKNDDNNNDDMMMMMMMLFLVSSLTFQTAFGAEPLASVSRPFHLNLHMTYV